MTELQYPLTDIRTIEPLPSAKRLTDQGHALREGIGGRDGSASLAWHLTAKAGAPGVRHTHAQHDEVIFHIDGSGLAAHGDQTFAVTPGTCRYVPRGTPHYFVANQSGPATAVGFLIGATSYDSDLSETGEIAHAEAATDLIAMPEISDGLAVHLDDVRPEQMATNDGWSITDFRLPIAGHNGCASTLFRARFMPGAIHNKHRHDKCDEIYFIISGHGMAGAGDDRVEVTAGQFHYIPDGVEHWLYNLSDTDPIEVIGIYVNANSVAATGYVYMGEVEAADLQT